MGAARTCRLLPERSGWAGSRCMPRIGHGSTRRWRTTSRGVSSASSVYFASVTRAATGIGCWRADAAPSMRKASRRGSSARRSTSRSRNRRSSPGSDWNPSCASHRRWKPSVRWRAASPTISTTCSAPFWVMGNSHRSIPPATAICGAISTTPFTRPSARSCWSNAFSASAAAVSPIKSCSMRNPWSTRRSICWRRPSRPASSSRRASRRPTPGCSATRPTCIR
jgi:hypothetical protein